LEAGVDIFLWIAGVLIALFALDRLFLWMEARGWVYWRKVKRKSAGGGAMLGVNSIFDGSSRHTAEAREERQMEEEEDGDDDGKRPPQDRLS
jgi:hypothetical protein